MTDPKHMDTPLGPNDDAALEAFFEAARVEDPLTSLPEGLMARVLADAQNMQPARVLETRAPKSEAARGWRHWVQDLGGWPSLAALSCAAMAGVWIGYSPPAGLEGVSELLGSSAVDTGGMFNAFASYNDFLAQEG